MREKEEEVKQLYLSGGLIQKSVVFFHCKVKIKKIHDFLRPHSNLEIQKGLSLKTFKTQTVLIEVFKVGTKTPMPPIGWNIKLILLV